MIETPEANLSIGMRQMNGLYGFTLKEIADCLQIHYSTVSKVIGKGAINKK
jgi:DNA-directed RNA polymerase specialized sigma54-like protein